MGMAPTGGGAPAGHSQRRPSANMDGGSSVGSCHAHSTGPGMSLHSDPDSHSHSARRDSSSIARVGRADPQFFTRMEQWQASREQKLRDQREAAAAAELPEDATFQPSFNKRSLAVASKSGGFYERATRWQERREQRLEALKERARIQEEEELAAAVGPQQAAKLLSRERRAPARSKPHARRAQQQPTVQLSPRQRDASAAPVQRGAKPAPTLSPQQKAAIAARNKHTMEKHAARLAASRRAAEERNKEPRYGENYTGRTTVPHEFQLSFQRPEQGRKRAAPAAQRDLPSGLNKPLEPTGSPAQPRCTPAQAAQRASPSNGDRNLPSRQAISRRPRSEPATPSTAGSQPKAVKQTTQARVRPAAKSTASPAKSSPALAPAAGRAHSRLGTSPGSPTRRPPAAPHAQLRSSPPGELGAVGAARPGAAWAEFARDVQALLGDDARGGSVGSPSVTGTAPPVPVTHHEAESDSSEGSARAPVQWWDRHAAGAGAGAGAAAAAAPPAPAVVPDAPAGSPGSNDNDAVDSPIAAAEDGPVSPSADLVTAALARIHAALGSARGAGQASPERKVGELQEPPPEHGDGFRHTSAASADERGAWPAPAQAVSAGSSGSPIDQPPARVPMKAAGVNWNALDSALAAVQRNASADQSRAAALQPTAPPVAQPMQQSQPQQYHPQHPPVRGISVAASSELSQPLWPPSRGSPSAPPVDARPAAVGSPLSPEFDALQSRLDSVQRMLHSAARARGDA